MDFIKTHWEKNAIKFETEKEASWGDECAIELEVNTIEKHIRENTDVLDVGCANGYSTIKQWNKKKLNSIIGVDYSPSMIRYANKNKERHALEKASISFMEGDIRSLNFADNSFDTVYTTRVLINLPNWDEQKKAIEECIRVTKKGGKIVLCEAFWEPLCRLNAMRLLMGLDPLVEHDFNRYLKFNNLELFLDEKKAAYNREDFSSLYYLGSRLFREIVTEHNNYKGYSNPINMDFYKLENKYSGGNIGIQQAYVIIK